MNTKNKPEWLDSFRKKASGGEGKFMRASDFEESRTITPIAFKFNGEKIPCFCYLEGWINETIKNEKGKNEIKSKCIRFLPDAQIDMDQEWSIGKVFHAGDKPKPQVPQPAVGLVVGDHQTQTIKVVSFTQKTILQHLMAYLDPGDDFFIENWEGHNMIIGKASDNKYKVESRQNNGFPDWLKKALADFTFSWEAYLNCEEPFENGDKYDDDNDSGFTFVEKWGSTKTSKGKPLSECTIEELNSFKDILDSKQGYDKASLLYTSILSGIKVMSEQSESDV